MDRLFFIAVLSALMLLGSIDTAQADLTRKVNCDAGQTIQQALDASEGPGGELVIIVRGTCEGAQITRDNITIQGEAGATIVGRLIVFGPARVTLRNLAITGPEDGLVVRGGRARVIDCQIFENEGIGVAVRDGAMVALSGVTDVSDNLLSGILVDNSDVRIAGRVAGNGEDGVRVDRQGNVVLQGSAVVEGNHQSGIQLRLHSTLDLTEQSQVLDNWDLDIYAVEDSAIRVSSGDVNVPGVVACDDNESSFRVVEGAEEANLPEVYCSDFN